MSQPPLIPVDPERYPPGLERIMANLVRARLVLAEMPAIRFIHEDYCAMLQDHTAACSCLPQIRLVFNARNN